MFIREWQRRLPGTTTLAVRGLTRRRQVRSGLRVDRELDGAPAECGDELETMLIAAQLFAGIALFHKPSRMTDLVLNIGPEDLSYAPRLFAQLLGSTAPDGKAPIYLRLLLRFGGRVAELAAARLIAFARARDFRPWRLVQDKCDRAPSAIPAVAY
jgi:hypothetical protein